MLFRSLDIDGVLTTEDTRCCLCTERMEKLGRILEVTGANIVISSSWRRYTLEDTITRLLDRDNPYVNDNPFPFTDHVVGVTARMYSFKHGERDVHYSISRGEEIHRYLEEHKEVESYVIIDDSPDMLYYQRYNFVHTNTFLGISDNDTLKAIDILNAEQPIIF